MPRKIEYARTFLYPRDMWKHVKIKEADKTDIKEMRQGGYPVKEIALKYSVTPQTIRDILKGGATTRPGNKTVEQKRVNRNNSAARRRFLLSMGMLVKKVKIITEVK